MLSSCTMFDVVQELVEKKHFSLMTHAEKVNVIQNGRPKPALPDLKSEQKEKNRSYTRCFNTASYNKFPWLTGSIFLNRLYCWPCLLFSTEATTWTKHGFTNLNYFVTACEKHQKSGSHLRAFAALQLFDCTENDNGLNVQKKGEYTLHNEKVKENRIILKRLIDIVIQLGKQISVFGNYDESKGSNRTGLCLEQLEFLALYDPVLANYLKTSVVFNGAFPLIQRGIIYAVASVITDKIEAEIKETDFVALLLNETSDVANKSQLSTVIKFVDVEGNCQERFLHFKDVSTERTVQGLAQHITGVLEDLHCSGKCIALTMDGAVIAASDVFNLQKAVREKYTAITFMHSHDDRLSFLMSQATSSIRECRRFFISLSSISGFFSNSSGRRDSLKKFMAKELPDTPIPKWNFSSKLVNTVKVHKSHLINFFLSIEEEPSDWSPEEVIAASGFVRFLSRFDTAFLLIVFQRIFIIMDNLHHVLLDKWMDMSSCSNRVAFFLEALLVIQDECFDQIWAETLNDVDEDTEPKEKHCKKDADSFKRIFYEILDTIRNQLKIRFEYQKSLEFISLLNSSNFPSFRVVFPDILMSNLLVRYSGYFDHIRLKNELKVFYSMEEYSNTPVSDIPTYLKSKNLHVVFTEVYKLAELILTFPFANTQIKHPASKRIKTYLRATQGQRHASDFSILAIEKDIVVDLRSRSDESFYENIILKFTQKEQMMDFVYK